METLDNKLAKLDGVVINLSRTIAFPLARFALFLIYFWFGALKVFGESPANPLVANLLEKTLPGISFASFIVVFGVFEMIIGLLFIIPHLERLGVFLLLLHIGMTIMPLFILPAVAWQGFMTPTLEGQYMIKNILIITCAVVVLSNLRPFQKKI